MSVGLTNRFNILEQSPHDLDPCEEPLAPASRKESWSPSRYTFRAWTTDGRLALWNSYTGAISVFRAEQSPTIESMLSQRGFEAEADGVVKYLADRGFLVKKGTDEYARFQLAFGKRQHRSDLLELILMASEDCNFRCVYCYEKFARGTMRPEVREGVKKMVEARLPGLRALSIGWFGGEPLYGMQAIEELAPFLLKTAEENSLHFRSHMTTNGYLLTPETAEKLLSWHIDNFQITLDGPAQCHDHSRPLRNGEGSFERIFNNLRSLSGRPENFEVHLRVNFNPENVPHMTAFLEDLEREFREDSRFRLRFRAVGKWGGENDENLEVCGLDEGDRLVLEFERLAQERGLTLADGFKASSTLGAQVCYAARPTHFIIGASGKLMKCTVLLDEDDRNVVGRITPEGRMEIDYDKMAPWVAPYFEKDSQCQRCVVLPTCQGFSCPLPRLNSNSRPCIPTRSNWKKELLSAVDRTSPLRHRTLQTRNRTASE